MEPSEAERPALDQELRRALAMILRVFGPSSQVIMVEDNPETGQPDPGHRSRTERV